MVAWPQPPHLHCPPGYLWDPVPHAHHGSHPLHGLLLPEAQAKGRTPGMAFPWTWIVNACWQGCLVAQSCLPVSVDSAEHVKHCIRMTASHKMSALDFESIWLGFWLNGRIISSITRLEHPAPYCLKEWLLCSAPKTGKKHKGICPKAPRKLP